MSLARTALARSLRLSTHTHTHGLGPLQRPPCRLSLPLPALAELQSVRTYASKKNKSKGGGNKDRDDHVDEDQPAATSKKSNSTENLVPLSEKIAAGEVYFKAEDSMKTTRDWFRKEVAAMETRANGRVTPAILAPVRVTVGGKPARLEDIATVGVREGTTLLISVFEEQVSSRLRCSCAAGGHAELIDFESSRSGHI